MKHIFSEKIELGAYYSYNDQQKKVYDVEGIKRDFQNLLEKLKKRSS